MECHPGPLTSPATTSAARQTPTFAERTQTRRERPDESQEILRSPARCHSVAAARRRSCGSIVGTFAVVHAASSRRFSQDSDHDRGRAHREPLRSLRHRQQVARAHGAPSPFERASSIACSSLFARVKAAPSPVPSSFISSRAHRDDRAPRGGCALVGARAPATTAALAASGRASAGAWGVARTARRRGCPSSP